MIAHELNENLFKNRVSKDALEASIAHVYCVENFGDNEFRAVVPAPMAEDFGYGFTDSLSAWAWIVVVREKHPDGKLWAIDSEQKEECAKHLFDALADVCINEDEELDQDFLHFEKGTDRSEVWHWLESEFDVSIAELEGVA